MYLLSDFKLRPFVNLIEHDSLIKNSIRYFILSIFTNVFSKVYMRLATDQIMSNSSHGVRNYKNPEI